MIVVAVASQKGGSGKTTLSGHLAVEAERAGAGPVTLIDTDPQGSLSQWWNARAARAPQFAKVGAFELQSALSHLSRTGTRLAIIDTPPAISESISHVIAHADLVIVPTRPSPHDLRAVGATVDMAERFGKPLIFVINGATPRARITGEAAVALSQHGVVAPVFIHHRVDFAASMVDGRTVGEAVPKSASAKEIGDLWVYIQDRVARLTKDASLSPEAVPAHFALASLSGLDATEVPEAEVVRAVTAPIAAVPPASAVPPPPSGAQDNGEEPWNGVERRSRVGAFFAGVERRTSVFGRRHAEQIEASVRK
ncbi:MAG TPA: ParA family protein [Micropepsaceae bacterium]|nr:ParA family protein [Micropepsaceae bacterium]